MQIEIIVIVIAIENRVGCIGGVMGKMYLYIMLFIGMQSIGLSAAVSNSELIETIKNGNLDEVKNLVEKGFDIDLFTRLHGTPASWALKYNRISILDYLITNGAKITPELVEVAIAQERFDLAEEYIEKCSKEDLDKSNVIYLAAEKGNLAFFKLLTDQKKVSLYKGDSIDDKSFYYSLLEKCARNDVLDYLESRHKLFSAAIDGDLKTIKAFFERNGVSWNYYKNMRDRNMLHIAALRGHIEIVKYLIGQSKDGIDALDFENNVPLYLAGKNGYFEIVKLLVYAGASINKSILGKIDRLYCYWGSKNLPIVLFINWVYDMRTYGNDKTFAKFVDNQIHDPGSVAVKVLFETFRAVLPLGSIDLIEKFDNFCKENNKPFALIDKAQAFLSGFNILADSKASKKIQLLWLRNAIKYAPKDVSCASKNFENDVQRAKKRISELLYFFLKLEEIYPKKETLGLSKRKFEDLRICFKSNNGDDNKASDFITDCSDIGVPFSGPEVSPEKESFHEILPSYIFEQEKSTLVTVDLYTHTRPVVVSEEIIYPIVSEVSG